MSIDFSQRKNLDTVIDCIIDNPDIADDEETFRLLNSLDKKSYGLHEILYVQKMDMFLIQTI